MHVESAAAAGEAANATGQQHLALEVAEQEEAVISACEVVTWNEPNAVSIAALNQLMNQAADLTAGLFRVPKGNGQFQYFRRVPISIPSQYDGEIQVFRGFSAAAHRKMIDGIMKTVFRVDMVYKVPQPAGSPPAKPPAPARPAAERVSARV